jgi:hypothetical protein
MEIDVASIQGCEVDEFSSEGDERLTKEAFGMVEHVYRL